MLFQRFHDGDLLLAVLDGFLGKDGVHHQPLVGVEGGVAQSAVKHQPLGAGIADKHRIVKIGVIRLWRRGRPLRPDRGREGGRRGRPGDLFRRRGRGFSRGEGIAGHGARLRGRQLVSVEDGR